LIMRQSDIAAVIERDLLRSDSEQPTNTTKCFSCGYGMVYRGNRFCSDRCRNWYDAGNPGDEQGWLRHKPTYRWRDGRPMRMGARGFHINCAQCQKEFESLGLRCCSTECERSYRERQENLAVMAEVGIGPAPKRQCANPDCGQTIPKWRNGRKVSAKTRFCSPKCSRRCRTPDTLQTVANT
jgi:hypothetical protein